MKTSPRPALPDAKFKKQITIVVVVAVLLIIGIIVVAVTAVMRGNLSILPGSSQKEGFWVPWAEKP